VEGDCRARRWYVNSSKR